MSDVLTKNEKQEEVSENINRMLLGRSRLIRSSKQDFTQRSGKG